MPASPRWLPACNDLSLRAAPGLARLASAKPHPSRTRRSTPVHARRVRPADGPTAVGHSIPFQRRQPIVHRERGHETLLDLPANHHQTRLSVVGAPVGLHEVGLEAAEATLAFGPRLPESGAAKLEEAVVAYREALKERTRERVPLDWATSLGNQDVALMYLAERREDAAMAEAAFSQINTAFETMRDGGHASNAVYYEQHIPKARARVARLRGR
jgi:hypothetical protein